MKVQQARINMARNKKKGRHSCPKHVCPVCGNTTGSCKLNHDGSIYCYHTQPHEAPQGYVYIRELSGGMGHEFIQPYIVDELLKAANTLHSQGKKASCKEMSDLTGFPSSWAMAVQKAYPSDFPEWDNYKNSSYNCSRVKTKKTVVENFPEASVDEILNEEERDKQYRQVLEQLQLNQNHHTHLQEVRGLGDLIDYICFRSWEEIKVQNISSNLPGVVERNGSIYLWGQTGIFLPMHNELGQIIAFQLSVDDKETGKYKWGSSEPVNGKSPRLDNDEMPLTFCRPKSVKLNSVGLAEGILKVWLAACNLEQIIIGAPGAGWDCSPKLFKRYLEKVASEQNIPLSNLVVDLYADAGMLNNWHIMLRYHQTINLLQQWGCNVRIGWWGQFTKEDLDIDDLILKKGRERLTYISVSEWMKLWSEDMRQRLLYDSTQDTSDWQAPVRHPDRSELGYWKKVKGVDGAQWQWNPKTGFSLVVERELIGTNNNQGGLVLQVKRSYDSSHEQDRVVVPTEALHRVKDFIDCLSRSTGKIYFTNKLKPYELQSFLHKELVNYRARGGKAYKLSERLGRQSDGTWVFPDCQISEKGHLITPEESGWVLNDGLIAKEKIPTPKIHTEKEADVLQRLVSAMRKFFGSGFMPAFFTAAFTVAGLFYDEILEKEGFFPVLGLYGDAGKGKTIAAAIALSLLGFDQRAKINKASESAYHERFKLMGGLTQFLDDPDKAQISWICQQIKAQFGGGSRSVRENNQDPHSPLIVASNYSIGDDDPIILSRLSTLR